MKELIVAGTDVNMYGEESVSPLQHAVRGENIEYVKELLKAGADVNSTDGVDTVLMVACKSDKEAIVKMLLEYGADVNFENTVGKTALYVAVTRGHSAYKRGKSKKKSKYSLDAVYFRKSPYMNIVLILLKKGACLNTPSSGLNPCTAHLQPSYSDLPIKMLSAAGAEDIDMDTENSSLKGLTSNLYHIISKLGLPFIIQSYLLFNTLPNYYKDLNNSEREFLLKVLEGDIRNSTHLVERGMDVNVQSDNGMTALMIASEAGHVELIEMLYWTGADVNIQNSVGDTALILATIKGQTDCVEELLKFRADANIRGNDGLTALMYAAMGGNITCLGMLLDSGAEPNTALDDDTDKIIMVSRIEIVVGSKGTTAIMYAAQTVSRS